MFFILLLGLVLSEEYEHAVIYGNTEILGYYYAEIMIGTPPMLQTVIVDTGSRLTAFPCNGCENCGTHMDQYFNYLKSASSRLISCDEGVHCSSCNNNVCEYSQSYAEGSFISGILIEDKIMLGSSLDHNHFEEAIIGCHQKETYLFRTQKADGIMGLGYSSGNIPSLIDILYSKNNVNTDIFALCLGRENGYMTIGGYNSSLHLSSLEWAGLYDTVFYSVKAVDVLLEDSSLNLSSKDFTQYYSSGTIVDSGTTFTYLTKKVFDAVVEGVKKYCSGEGKCDGEKVSVYGEHMCFKHSSKKYLDIHDFFNTFPSIKLVVEKILVEWRPEYYLFSWPNTPDSYCLGFYSNGNGGSVLGGNFMRGMDVVFDRTEKKIGFAQSDCLVEDLHKPRLTTPVTEHANVKSMNYSITLVVVVSCLFTSLVTITIFHVYKKRSAKAQVLEESQEST